MYRYRDRQGHTQELADDNDLRKAIADGRVRTVTPFASEGEEWTAAGKHPDFLRLLEERQQRALSRKAQYRKFARIAAPLLALTLGVYARRGDFSNGDRDQLIAAVSGVAEGGAIPAEILDSPPRRQSDRAIWVVITATHDAEQEMAAAEQSHGVVEAPYEWMRPAYMLHASRYQHVARYFDAFAQFHAIYRDSVVPIAERALQARAAQADLDEEHLTAILEENRNSGRQVILYFDVLRQWSREARRLHDVLVAAEPHIRGVRGDHILFSQEWSKAQYEAAMKSLVEIEARRDALELKIEQSAQDDFAQLMGN